MIVSDINSRIYAYTKQALIQDVKSIRVYAGALTVAQRDYSQVDNPSESTCQFSFYLGAEDGKNNQLTKLELIAKDGKPIARQMIDIHKGYPESFLILWTMEVV